METERLKHWKNVLRDGWDADPLKLTSSEVEHLIVCGAIIWLQEREQGRSVALEKAVFRYMMYFRLMKIPSKGIVKDVVTQIRKKSKNKSPEGGSGDNRKRASVIDLTEGCWKAPCHGSVRPVPSPRGAPPEAGNMLSGSSRRNPCHRSVRSVPSVPRGAPPEKRAPRRERRDLRREWPCFERNGQDVSSVKKAAPQVRWKFGNL